MRNFFSNTLAAALLFFVSQAQATPVITVNDVTQPGIPTPGVSTGGFDLFTFSIDNVNNEDYDTIDVDILPHSGNSFILDKRRRMGLLFPVPGSDDTFFHSSLLFQGFALLGIEESAQRLSGVITTLGGSPTSDFNGDFAQVVGNPGLGFDYTIRFASSGVQVLDTVTGRVGVPEPCTVNLASFVIVSLLGRGWMCMFRDGNGSRIDLPRLI